MSRSKTASTSGMPHCGEVMDLFGNDPVCRFMIWVYCDLPIWAYVGFWFFLMVGLPLGAAWMASHYGLRTAVYLPRAVFPPLASWLAYRWFASMVRVRESLAEKNLVGPHTEFRITPKCMRHWLGYAIAVGLTCGIAVYTYGFGKNPGMHPAERLIALLGSLVWWYAIVRTAQMAILIFLDYRRFLASPGLAKELNLFDTQNAFGLKALIQHTYRFLLLYILIIGGYLFYYQVFMDVRADVRGWLSPVLWGFYFGFPVYNYVTTLRPASRLVHKRKSRFLDELAQKMAESEERGDYGRLEQYQRQYDRLKSVRLPSYPFSFPRLLSRFALQIGIGMVNVITSAWYTGVIERKTTEVIEKYLPWLDL